MMMQSSPQVPLSVLQGVYCNHEYGTLTLYEAGNIFLFEMASNDTKPGQPVLEGVAGPISDLEFGVFEIGLLGYKDYHNPMMRFTFVLADDGHSAVGFRVDVEGKEEWFSRA
ncbi:hypothetical protein HK100_005003 [Physocladia obscura]|uniref:Uncharacterized protein n=1 Tax=Physocladia obscura TaxID=109957 RepID=A0AAD5XC68_9FUNG|nr:hypothetical protein HK100_005003 [Physocladia obscura]